MTDKSRQKARQGKESFVLGITGLLLHLLAYISANGFFWFESVALIVGIVGLILGITSRRKLKENNRFALVGMILSILTLIGFALSAVYFFIMLSRIGNAISAITANPW